MSKFVNTSQATKEVVIAPPVLGDGTSGQQSTTQRGSATQGYLPTPHDFSHAPISMKCTARWIADREGCPLAESAPPSNPSIIYWNKKSTGASVRNYIVLVERPPFSEFRARKRKVAID